MQLQTDYLFDDGPGVQNQLVERPARLFKCGEYADKNLTITTDHLDSIVALSASLPEIPLDLSPHGNTDANLPTALTGKLLPASIKRVGDWIHGIIQLPQQIDAALKNRKLSVVLDKITKAIKKVAVVPNPRVAGAEFSADGYEFGDGEMESNDGSYLAQALEALRANGFDLPEDTDAANVLERIVVAGRAIASAKSTAEPAKQNETEHPAPIAMSEGTMPNETVVFSDPSASIPPALRKAYRKQYIGRIESLVQSRRITAKYANEHLSKLLGKTDSDFTFSVDSEGDVSAPVLDGILMGLEALPEGCVLTGPLAATERALRAKGRSNADVKFALTVPEHDEVDPEFTGDDTEAAEVTKTMLRMSGAKETA